MINLEKKKDQLMKKSSHTLEYVMLLITALILCCSGFIYENLYIVLRGHEVYYIFNLLLVLFIFLVPLIILIVKRRQTQDTFTRSFTIIYMVVVNYLFFMLKWIIPGYDIDELSLLYILIGEVVLLLLAFVVIYLKNKWLRLALYLVATGFNVFLIWLQLIIIAFRGGGPN